MKKKQPSKDRYRFRPRTVGEIDLKDIDKKKLDEILGQGDIIAVIKNLIVILSFSEGSLSVQLVTRQRFFTSFRMTDLISNIWILIAPPSSVALTRDPELKSFAQRQIRGHFCRGHRPHLDRCSGQEAKPVRVPQHRNVS